MYSTREEFRRYKLGRASFTVFPRLLQLSLFLNFIAYSGSGNISSFAIASYFRLHATTSAPRMATKVQTQQTQQVHTGIAKPNETPIQREHTLDDARAESALPKDSLTHAILTRHSTRMFLPKPVPFDILRSCLSLAQHSPSNSNTQPWRLFIAHAAAKDRLDRALLAAASEGDPKIPPLPEPFRHYRSALGKQIYGPEGMNIAREDKVGHLAAVRRNFAFFGAPLAAVVCMHKDLKTADSMSVGLYLQTLVLALTESGLDTCMEVSVTGYPEILKRELEIDEDLIPISGLAVGYEDPNAKVNSTRAPREHWENHVKFLDK